MDLSLVCLNKMVDQTIDFSVQYSNSKRIEHIAFLPNLDHWAGHTRGICQLHGLDDSTRYYNWNIIRQYDLTRCYLVDVSNSKIPNHNCNANIVVLLCFEVHTWIHCSLNCRSCHAFPSNIPNSSVDRMQLNRNKWRFNLLIYFFPYNLEKLNQPWCFLRRSRLLRGFQMTPRTSSLLPVIFRLETNLSSASKSSNTMMTFS